MSSPLLAVPFVGSRPEALRALGEAAPPAADDLRRAARRLSDALSAWNGSLGEPSRRRPDPVGPSVRHLALLLEEADGWAGRVGEAFAEADRWGAFADLVHLPLPDAPATAGDVLAAALAAGRLDLVDDDLLARVPPAELAEAGRDAALPLLERDRLGRAAIAALLAGGAVGEEDRIGLEAALESDVRVLAFHPPEPGRDPRLQAVLGDLGRADAVAVWVPGTGHGVHSFGRNHEIGTQLAAAGLAHGSSLAVVLDLYDAPDHLGAAASTRYAVTHVPALVQLGAQLDQLAPGRRVVAIGHSYGSHVVGRGAVAGLDVDGVVLVGSPGVGVRHADELGVGEVWAARAPKDPIELAADADGLLGGPLAPTAWALGPDPVDADFGASAFEVNDPATTPDQDVYVSGHGEYLDVGTRSLANIAAIVAGLEPSLPSAADVGRRLDSADARGPGIIDRWTARLDPEWYAGSDATRAQQEQP